MAEPDLRRSERQGKTILACGSREWRDRSAVHLVLMCEPHRRGWDGQPITVITGGARGADSFAATSAMELGYESIVVPAEWDIHGKAAGPIRNRKMLDMAPDLVVAFGQGRGTDDCVREAERRQVPVMRL
jgi:predicted Rossmann-fold nucleotide-binding protein